MNHRVINNHNKTKSNKQQQPPPPRQQVVKTEPPVQQIVRFVENKQTILSSSHHQQKHHHRYLANNHDNNKHGNINEFLQAYTRHHLYNESFRSEYEYTEPIGKQQENDDPFPIAWMPYVYVLSIRAKRMNDFMDRMGSWGLRYLKRFPCSYGRAIPRQKWVQQGWLSKESGQSWTSGQIGCAHSHYRIWYDFIHRTDLPFITVFEDDFDISCDRKQIIMQRVNDAYNELTNHQVPWSLLFWGHGPWVENTSATYTCSHDQHTLVHWRRPLACQGFFAYTISRSFAQHLLSATIPFRHLAIDTFVFETYRNHPLYLLLSLEPILGFIVPADSETTQLK